ncbi:hypothetical protein Glove_804g10 [Diversispora epigaea]|uniref:Uncharacterized protein n=1 Tax=Diversispora epigaea TaxID=1348612 RepID=A0A397G3K2_9GLOM|nr:hypothetical protein Glove_804g10 [Diversispora epigaea]
MVNVLNKHREDYKICDIKKLRVFSFQAEEYNRSISVTFIVDRGLYCRALLKKNLFTNQNCVILLIK